jgi:hypothetical protein
MSDGETTQQVGEPRGTSTVCAVVLIGTMVIETTFLTSGRPGRAKGRGWSSWLIRATRGTTYAKIPYWGKNKPESRKTPTAPTRNCCRPGSPGLDRYQDRSDHGRQGDEMYSVAIP